MAWSKKAKKELYVQYPPVRTSRSVNNIYLLLNQLVRVLFSKLDFDLKARGSVACSLACYTQFSPIPTQMCVLPWGGGVSPVAYWVVPEKIHTPLQRKFVLSGGGGRKKCLRMSEGGRGDADL